MTGAAGFVGSNVVDVLVARGDEVMGMDDLSTGDAANLGPSQAPLLVTDISDRDSVQASTRGMRFDAVVHLASKTKVGESVDKPDLYRRVIVEGTRNVLEAARTTGAERFINISSGGVIYGDTGDRCATESDPMAPVSPYGRYKAEAEGLVAGAGIPAITLRPANIYGPRQRTDLEGGVVAIFQARWRTREPIEVRGDGVMERDYVYVGDIGDAIVGALSTENHGVYNVGTGVSTSVNALVKAMSVVLGPPPEIRQVPALAGELQRNCLDSAKATRDGVGQPRTSLADGLRRTLT